MLSDVRAPDWILFFIVMLQHLYFIKLSFSVAIGLLYPFCDRRLGETVSNHRGEWSNVMRCVAVFVGINHASAVSFL